MSSPVCAEQSPGEERPPSALGGHQTDVPRRLPVRTVRPESGDAAYPRLPRPGLPRQGVRTQWRSGPAGNGPHQCVKDSPSFLRIASLLLLKCKIVPGAYLSIKFYFKGALRRSKSMLDLWGQT